MTVDGLILAGVVGAACLFWPRHGVLARWRSARRLAARTRQEDALKHILKGEVNGQRPTVASVAGALRLGEDRTAALLAEMEEGGLLSFAGGSLHLRPAGRELAVHIIRAHRLWESFLADQTGVREADWHRKAERKEHLLTPQQISELAARLGHPLRDPHGDAIPEDGEALPADHGRPVTEVESGVPLRIVHLEDEPDAVYRQLVAAGLKPGMAAEVRSRTPDGIHLSAEGREVRLSTLQANNVSVQLLPRSAPHPAPEPTLAGLAPGASGRVTGLAPACRGAARRRLLDLGFVPGTEVQVELRSPNGDPTAYRVRGTLVALRREQAALIRIEKEAA